MTKSPVAQIPETHEILLRFLRKPVAQTVKGRIIDPHSYLATRTCGMDKFKKQNG